MDPNRPMPWEFDTMVDNRDGPAWNWSERWCPNAECHGFGLGCRSTSGASRKRSDLRTIGSVIADSISHARSAVSRVKSILGPVFKAVALVVATAWAVGPEAVQTRAEEAVFALWRAVGDELAQRELTTIGRQLDRDRQDAELICAARDDLRTRLVSLKTQSELLVAEIEQCGTRHGARERHELARLENAIATIKSTAARADLVLRGADEDLRLRELELIALQAGHDARRMNRALAQPIGDAVSWSGRIARARAILGTASEDQNAPDMASDLHARSE
jgi:hypothetical protein